MEVSKKLSTKSIISVGMFTAVISILSQLSIPMPSGVPATLQTFAIALTGYIVGWRLAGASCAIYVLIGALGVPVYANFTGGLGVLLGNPGGFLFGFIFMAILCGIGMQIKKGALIACLFGILGLALCHTLGIIQFTILTEMSFMQSMLLVSVPYMIKDIISVILAFFIGREVRKRLRL